jgi:hypothetical protein
MKKDLLLNIGLTLLCIYIFFKSLMAISKFVGLSFNYYINYLLWIIALLLFWIFLPKKPNTIFSYYQ